MNASSFNASLSSLNGSDGFASATSRRNDDRRQPRDDGRRNRDGKRLKVNLRSSRTTRPKNLSFEKVRHALNLVGDSFKSHPKTSLVYHNPESNRRFLSGNPFLQQGDVSYE